MVGTFRRSVPYALGIVMTAAALVAPGASARAAENPTIGIQNMSIDLRPEYDTSDVLIIYDFALTNKSNTQYSGDIQFHVPKGATNQVHICEQENGNKHAICRPYKTADAGDSTLMTWKPSKPIEPGQSYPIYVEYYYNPIQGTPDKQIDFLYHPSYQVDLMTLSVTQPLRSSNWKLDPSPAFSGGTGDGMTQYNYTFKDVQEGKPVELAISYTKGDNKPSIAKTEVAASNATAMSNGAKIAVGGVLVAIFGGLLYLGLRRKPTVKLVRPAGRSVPARPGRAAPPSAPRPAQSRPAPSPKARDERRMARQMLIEGRISEATYQMIVADLDAEEAR